MEATKTKMTVNLSDEWAIDIQNVGSGKPVLAHKIGKAELSADGVTFWRVGDRSDMKHRRIPRMGSMRSQSQRIFKLVGVGCGYTLRPASV